MMENVGPRVASIGTRILSAVIDFVMIWAIGFIMGLFWGTPQDPEESTIISFSLQGTAALIFFLFAISFPVLEGITGQTIGKKIMKIKVLKKNYEKAGIGRSLARHFFDWIDGFLFLGFIIASKNAMKQRIGDMVADTIVVRI